MARKLSIIIPSYNSKKITERCLISLQKILPSEEFECEIIVVDNASTDGTTELLSHLQISGLRVIKNKKNLGFSKANNQGLKTAKGEYILFLNSDVVIEKVQFKRLLNYFDSRQDVGALTVRVNRADGSIDPASHRGFPTIWNSLCYFLKFERLFRAIPFVNRVFGGYHLVWNDLWTIHEIDSPSGAFYLTRKKLLDKLKGFDEDFFMYGEDIDLSFRIKSLGLKILYYPLFHVLHLKYASGLGTNDAKVQKEIKKHFYNAMKIFYKKHYEKAHSPIVNKMIYWLVDLKSKI